jgi:hypothetical protein
MADTRDIETVHVDVPDDNAITSPIDSGSEGHEQVLDPNDSDSLRNRIRGQTGEHAFPPRLEDEGQSGG